MKLGKVYVLFIVWWVGWDVSNRLNVMLYYFKEVRMYVGFEFMSKEWKVGRFSWLCISLWIICWVLMELWIIDGIVCDEEYI